MKPSQLAMHPFDSSRPSARWARCLFLGLGVLLALAALTAPRAAAIGDGEELIRFGGAGSGAGELSFPNGVATEPSTGHVYVVDTNNNRVSEFTPWGDFVKAFGWDVAPGAVNEQQEVRIRASGGQFKLGFKAATTTDLAFNAPGSASEGAGSVEAALNALSTIGGAGGSVSVRAVPGTADGIAPYVYAIAFKGSLAGENADQLTVANGTTSLSGGVPTTTLEARTRADGTPGGTGLESCTEESGCKAGLQGAGAGQLSQAQGLAVDADGNVFVREAAFSEGNNRVQKFDPAGRFLLMFGGEVNKTKTTEGKPEAERNRCTKAQLEGGDVCGAGTGGAGQGQLGASSAVGIAFDGSGRLFVGDVERIQRFDSEGEYEGETPVAGRTVHYLAVDPIGGDFYAVVGTPSGSAQDVRVLDAANGAEKGKLQAAELTNSKGEAIPATTETAGPIATDTAGNVFSRRNNLSLEDGTLARPVLQFDAVGKQTSEFGGLLPVSQVTGLATNAFGGLYVVSGAAGSITAFGSGPVSFEAAPKVPPTITEQFATAVGRTEAVLAAEINPHFWTDTRYYVEYGTGKCSEGGCDEVRPVPPGAVLAAKVIDAPLRSAGVFLQGLKPNTTYHYRFVAQSSGGGPVRGVGGEESTLVTYPAPNPLKTDCPNQSFRTGFSAPLSDCRAYEMVSPIDKGNGDIKALLSSDTFNTNLEQSSAGGERFTYSSYRAFAGAKGAGNTNQYLAHREEGVGWPSESLAVAQRPETNFLNSYKVFSEDLCMGLMIKWAEPVLALGATEGYANLYRRDNCGDQGYEALIQVDLSSVVGQFFPLLQGVSADGEEAVFLAEHKLTDDALEGPWQAYHTSEGELRLICILPSGAPSGGNCSGGTSDGAFSGNIERNSNLTHALSTDGRRVYWTDSAGSESGPGKVYLRLNPGKEQSAVSGGECTEAEKACTVKVSETETTQPSRFLRASADGTKALFEVTAGALAGDLYLFDSETAGSTLLAGESKGVAGASEDLSRIYFASEEVLPETSGASAGEPNLYLDEGGTKTFVATLSDDDVVEAAHISSTSLDPIYHAAKATADGSHLAFISTASLTGYDNTDQATGKADFEVFRYAAGSTDPVCLSCNPSGARPRGREVRVNGLNATNVPIAAMLVVPPSSPLHYPRVLSGDGSRIFFNSYDALLPRDTNGKADVYEWEEASGAGDCEQRGADMYVASSGGCLSLISSGESAQDSEFRDASANGDDVFFVTNASLLPQDPGLIDVYDARANGGLPAPPAPPAPCQGEACQVAPPPPNDPTPASASFKGAGNASAKKAKGRCAKGKARRKGRCVAKRQKRAKKGNHAQNADHDRRAQR